MIGTTASAIAGVRQRVPGVLDLGEARPCRPSSSPPRGRAGRPSGSAGEDVGRLGHEVHAAEHDVLRLGAGGGLAGQLERVPGDVGERDDLVALVVVAQHEDPVAERLLGGAGPGHQVRIGGGGQRPGAVDPALGAAVGAAAQRPAGAGRSWSHRHSPTAPQGRVRGSVHSAGTASAVSSAQGQVAACPQLQPAGHPDVDRPLVGRRDVRDGHGHVGGGGRQRLPEQVGRGAPVGGREQVGTRRPGRRTRSPTRWSGPPRPAGRSR